MHIVISGMIFFHFSNIVTLCGSEYKAVVCNWHNVVHVYEMVSILRAFLGGLILSLFYWIHEIASMHSAGLVK